MLQEDEKTVEAKQIFSAHFSKAVLEDGAELMVAASSKMGDEGNILSKGKITISSSFLEFVATDGNKLLKKKKAINKSNFDGLVPGAPIEFLVNAKNFKSILDASERGSNSLFGMSLEARADGTKYLSLGPGMGLDVDDSSLYPSAKVLLVSKKPEYEFLLCLSKKILLDTLACISDDTVSPYVALRFGVDSSIEKDSLNVVASHIYTQDGLELRAGRELEGVIMPIKPNADDVAEYYKKLEDFRGNNIFWGSTEYNSGLEYFDGLLKIKFFGRNYQYDLNHVEGDSKDLDLINDLKESLLEFSKGLSDNGSNLSNSYTLAILASIEARLALAGVKREDDDAK